MKTSTPHFKKKNVVNGESSRLKYFHRIPLKMSDGVIQVVGGAWSKEKTSSPGLYVSALFTCFLTNLSERLFTLSILGEPWFLLQCSAHKTSTDL